MNSNDQLTANTQAQTEEQQNQNQNQTQEFVSREFLVKAGIISDEKPKESDETQAPDATESAAAQSQDQGQQKPEETPKPAKQRKIARGYSSRAGVSVEEIAKVAATAAVEAINKSGAAGQAQAQPKQAQPAQQPDNLEQQIISRMDDEQKRLLETFEIVEKNNPEKYKNLKTNAIKALAEYERLRDEWLKENPEKTRDDFDEDGEVMAEIEQRFGIEVDEQDLIDANIKSQIEPVKQELERTRKELQEAKAILATERIQQTSKAATEQVLQAIGLKPEQADEIIRKETPSSEVLKREMDAVKNFIEATYLSFNGISHPLTEQVAELCQRYEDALLNMPENERVDNVGRKFISRDIYFKLPVQERLMIDKGTHPQYWGLNAEIASMIGASIIAERTKQNFTEAIKKEAKLLQEHGVKPKYPFMVQNNTGNNTGQRQPQTKRQVSPTSVNPLGGHTPGPQSSDVPSEFLQRFLGKAPIGGGVTYEPSKD